MKDAKTLDKIDTSKIIRKLELDLDDMKQKYEVVSTNRNDLWCKLVDIKSFVQDWKDVENDYSVKKVLDDLLEIIERGN